MTPDRDRDALADLDAELAGVERDVLRRIDPGLSAVVVNVCVLAVVGAVLLPWTAGLRGWEVLVGTPPAVGGGLGPLPQVFAGMAVAFGLVLPAVALATRRWVLAWVCAVGSGITTVTGVWAVWSRQVGTPFGASGPSVGLVLALVAVVVLAATWARLAMSRG